MVIALDAGQFADDVRLNLAKAGLGLESAGVELVSRMGGQVVTVDDAVAAARKLSEK
jgi:DNA/RNA-binding domain of Phe-tRNA-synthetase-like protein